MLWNVSVIRGILGKTSVEFLVYSFGQFLQATWLFFRSHKLIQEMIDNMNHLLYQFYMLHLWSTQS